MHREGKSHNEDGEGRVAFFEEVTDHVENVIETDGIYKLKSLVWIRGPFASGVRFARKR